jgi:NB-ARC domain
VVDNLRAENCIFWNSLQALLHESGEDSKVLITSCDKHTCRFMDALDRPSLTGLRDEQCWQLIQSIALPRGTINEKLVSIGRKIGKRCLGSPLAAKTFGYLLRGGSEEDWSFKLNEMRALKDDKHGVLERLKLCYDHLTYSEKQCFAYCCIFPNGCQFEKDQLIQFWMAEGLIRLENVGREYFENLVKRSFFETLTCRDQVERYRIPTLMCDLAQTVAGYDYLVSKCDYLPPHDETGQPRYASMLHLKDTPSINLDCIQSYSNLRTFILLAECPNHAITLYPISPQFFREIKHLHVLDLSNSDLKDIPDFQEQNMTVRRAGLLLPSGALISFLLVSQIVHT